MVDGGWWTSVEGDKNEVLICGYCRRSHAHLTLTIPIAYNPIGFKRNNAFTCILHSPALHSAFVFTFNNTGPGHPEDNVRFRWPKANTISCSRLDCAAVYSQSHAARCLCCSLNHKLNMTNPTVAQQKGIAYAHIPFAAISTVASAYVIYYLLIQKRKKTNSQERGFCLIGCTIG